MAPSMTTEALLWKFVQAAPILKAAQNQLHRCQNLSASLRLHLRRSHGLLALMNRASSCVRIVGAGTKIVGGLVSAAALTPRCSFIQGLGIKAWKAGSRLKLAGMSWNMLLELWKNGFRHTLSVYLRCVAGLIQSLSVLRSLLEELNLLVPEHLNCGTFLPMLLLVCPEDVFMYACHIVKLFTSPDQYSHFNNFVTMAVSTFSTPSSLPVTALNEAESFHALSSIELLPKTLGLASSIVLVGKELLDVFDSLPVRYFDINVVKDYIAKLQTFSCSLARNLTNSFTVS